LDGERSCVDGIDRTNTDGPRLQSLKASGVYLAPSITGSGSHCNVSHAVLRTRLRHPDRLRDIFSNTTIQPTNITWKSGGSVCDDGLAWTLTLAVNHTRTGTSGRKSGIDRCKSCQHPLQVVRSAPYSSATTRVSRSMSVASN
jgi:hypothetical protein